MNTCRIVEVNLEATDLDELVRFYEEAFAVRFDRDQHGDCPVHYHVVFGEWPTDSCFLLNINQSDDDLRLPSFGLLVDHLDASHGRAVEKGATDVAVPQDTPGLPRSSCLRDPSGNTLNLYQA